MSFQITEAFVQEFADNFRHVAQQKQSRFEPTVMIEPGIRGTSKSINRLGQRTAQRRTTRHGNTPLNDQPHSTRYLDLIDWEDGDMIDEQDKVRMLVDPTSDYVAAIVAALNRAKDRVVIDALGGAARTTVAGGTATLPAGQIIAAGGQGLTRAKLITAREIFRRNETDSEAGEDVYIAMSASGLGDLLTDTTMTTTEINTVLSMQSGTYSNATLFGFKVVPCEFLPLNGTTRSLFAYAKSGVSMGIGENIVTEVAKDPSRSFSTRVYCRMSIGAVRVEEEKVVQIDIVE